MDHEGARGTATRGERRAARGGRRLTGFLQQSLGLAGASSPQEIKARFRALARRCASGEADEADRERLRIACVAFVQELAFLGFDETSAARILAGEGVPDDVGAIVAPAAGPVARRVHDPIERQTVRPEDEAYARLGVRAAAAESLRTATVSSYGFGFIARLAIAFVIVIVALVAALDFFPRVLRPAKEAPQAAQPVPIQLVPAQKR